MTIYFLLREEKYLHFHNNDCDSDIELCCDTSEDLLKVCMSLQGLRNLENICSENWKQKDKFSAVNVWKRLAN